QRSRSRARPGAEGNRGEKVVDACPDRAGREFEPCQVASLKTLRRLRRSHWNARHVDLLVVPRAPFVGATPSMGLMKRLTFQQPLSAGTIGPQMHHCTTTENGSVVSTIRITSSASPGSTTVIVMPASSPRGAGRSDSGVMKPVTILKSCGCGHGGGDGTAMLSSWDLTNGHFRDVTSSLVSQNHHH